MTDLCSSLFGTKVIFCEPWPAVIRPRSMRQVMTPEVDGLTRKASYDSPGQSCDGALMVG